MSELRAYEPAECGKDGYPTEWHKTIKHLVRERAGHRCERCLHPYRVGTHGRGEWSPCDERCLHKGPIRNRFGIECPVPVVAGKMVEAGAAVIEAKWRILTVHHLDLNKCNLRWWNLAALCQRCHLQIQNKVKLHQTYPFEHSEWFRPFAAGFYAFSYLGEELTREETLERIDELLALELMSA